MCYLLGIADIVPEKPTLSKFCLDYLDSSGTVNAMISDYRLVL
jgi:hypothetical protein